MNKKQIEAFEKSIDCLKAILNEEKNQVSVQSAEQTYCLGHVVLIQWNSNKKWYPHMITHPPSLSCEEVILISLSTPGYWTHTPTRVANSSLITRSEIQKIVGPANDFEPFAMTPEEFFTEQERS